MKRREKGEQGLSIAALIIATLGIILLIIFFTPPLKAQQLATRVSMCGGLVGDTFERPSFCGITSFVELPQVGVFGQLAPRLGPIQDNWMVYVYKPNVTFSGLGLDYRTWPGVAVGRELGDWFVRLRADILFSVDVSPVLDRLNDKAR